MDILYFYRRSKARELELRYSLRSVERYAPWVQRVWIFGDRPEFANESDELRCVPHGYLTRVGTYRVPVENFFLMLYLSSLIPELSPEYLWFCDDFILLRDFDLNDAQRVRYLEDLSDVTVRGRGLWKDSLWRTSDVLDRLGYSTLNFETHVPTRFTKKWVLEAWCDLKDFVTEDRWHGLLGPSAVLNHAQSGEAFDIIRLSDEDSRAAFHGKQPNYEQVSFECRNRKFLNFDDDAFGPAIQGFLEEQFPQPSKYEKPDRTPVATPASIPDVSAPFENQQYPQVAIPRRDGLGSFLNIQGLVGKGVQAGTSRGVFAAEILRQWQGTLSCVDTWAVEESAFPEVAAVTADRHDANFAEATRLLAQFEHRCTLHRTTAKLFSEAIPSQSLDFVYLDQRLTGQQLQQALSLWHPKIKPGGILAGRDYLDGLLPVGRFETKATIDAWAKANNIQLQCTGERIWRSWIASVT